MFSRSSPPRPRRRSPPRSRSATGTSTRPRCTATRRRSAQAIAESDLDPSEVFVTSKLNNGFHAFDDALRAFDQTLADLRLERIDLFLIHWPLPKVGDFVETWKALERIYAEGRARAIGVSNFQAHHLRRLHEETDGDPRRSTRSRCTRTSPRRPLRAFDAEHEIATEAWSPIAQGGCSTTR